MVALLLNVQSLYYGWRIFVIFESHKGLVCFPEQDTSSELLGTGCFQEHIQTRFTKQNYLHLNQTEILYM